MVPFSTLNADSQLLGQYSLDDQYWLQSHNSSGFGGKSSSISGVVYFPSADISSYIAEDATNIEMQQKLIHLRSSTFSEEELFRDIVPTRQMDRKRLSSDESRALCTLRGFKGGPNQDRSVIVEYLVNTTRFGNVDVRKESISNNMRSETKYKRALLMGIFDGHGDLGHEVAQYVALNLPKIFARTMRKHHLLPGDRPPSGAPEDDLIRQVLRMTYLEADKNEPIKGSGGGCTASTMFYPGWGTKLYLANVGDSITIIAHYSKTSQISTIVKQSRQDKPHIDEERKRIEAAGGRVFIPFQLDAGSGNHLKESSRLLIPLGDGSQLGLAMSRSIGDAEGKPFGLISEPIVEVFDVKDYYSQQNYSTEEIDDSRWFVVIVSDGLYDVIPPNQVVQHLSESLYNDDVDSSSLETICEVLIRKAGRLWIKATADAPYRDDITLGVSKIY